MKSYFYIIKHITTGRYYAGCRYAVGCTPSELLSENGYITSSLIVKDIISKEGISSFIIDRIRTFETRDGAFVYESKFLKKVKASTNRRFINTSENTPLIDNTERSNKARIKTCMITYGVSNVLKYAPIKDKQVTTIRYKYGVDNISQLETISKRKVETRLKNNNGVYETEEQRTKRINTNIEKYGKEHPLKSEIVKAKVKETCIEKYGQESYLATEECRNTLLMFSLNTYGVDNVSKSPEVIDKIKQSNRSNLGVDWAMQNPDTVRKSKETCMAKYGVDSISKLPEFQDKKRKANIEKYGVDHFNKTPEAKQAKANRDKLKRERKVVGDIKKLTSFLNIKLGKGWDLKTDDKLDIIFIDLLEKFNFKGII